MDEALGGKGIKPHRVLGLLAGRPRKADNAGDAEGAQARIGAALVEAPLGGVCRHLRGVLRFVLQRVKGVRVHKDAVARAIGHATLGDFPVSRHCGLCILLVHIWLLPRQEEPSV